MQPSQVAFQALDYAQQLKVSIEADAQRKSDPGLRVPADYAFALLALLAAGGLVLGSIALGEFACRPFACIKGQGVWPKGAAVVARRGWKGGLVAWEMMGGGRGRRAYVSTNTSAVLRQTSPEEHHKRRSRALLVANTYTHHMPQP